MSFRQSTGVKRYMFADFLAAILSWILFFGIRKISVEEYDLASTTYLQDLKILYGALFSGLYWWLIFTLSNSYSSLYEKSRLAETLKTILLSFSGNILLFFLLILNDQVRTYHDYYLLFFMLFVLHLILTLSFRMILLFRAKSNMRAGKIEFPALLIGNNPNAVQVYHDLQKSRHNHGIVIKGLINENGHSNILQQELSEKGSLTQLSQVLQSKQYDYAILALTQEHKQQLPALIELIDEYGLRIKIIPELYEILAGKVTMTNVMGTLLVDVETQIMQPWQRVIKRAMDILFSGSALLILWPFFIYIALKVKRSSDGPIFFIQERIGFKGRAFQMYKFRSMYTDAEKNGPLLSHASDDRITTWGKIMRKYRIDELPQLYHVLTGEMSLVGPRPERAFFAQQMIEAAPQYKYLYKVKPGLTSWGMVRFGYASDLKAMLERMQYDLLYIENYSLLIDLRILIHTVLIILKGRGV